MTVLGAHVVVADSGLNDRSDRSLFDKSFKSLNVSSVIGGVVVDETGLGHRSVKL